MNPFNTYFKIDRYSTIVYNHFNEDMCIKIQEILANLKFITQQMKVDDQSYFALIYDVEDSKTEFLNQLRTAVSTLLKETKIQLISIDFEDAVGIVTTTDNKVKPLGLTIRNVPFASTTIEGDFIARPKTLDECFEVMKIAYEHDKYKLIYAEFGKRIDATTNVLSIEKTDKFPIIYAKNTTNIVV
jgi:hypothetical protein